VTNSAIKNSNAIITVAAVIIIIFGMQAAKVLLVPFLLAIFFALITVRPMLWLQAHKVPSALAAIAVVLALMMFLIVIGSIVGTSLAGFTAAMPSYQAQLDTIMQGALQFIGRFLDDDVSVASIGELINPGRAMSMAATLLNAIRGMLTNTFLILFTMVFILLEASSVETKVIAAFGRTAESFERAGLFLRNLGRYLGIKTIMSMVTGLTVGVMTWIIGLDFPLLWGMLAFILNYIPTIGSIIAAVPACLLALIQLGPAAASTTAIGFLAINTVFGNMIEPRFMGYGVGISPLVVFTGLIFWGWVFGPVGMLLSVPLTMALKLALESNERTQWIAILIGSERDADYALKKRDGAKAEQAEQT
jgi:predicted PurR-regulated permease PerM